MQTWSKNSTMLSFHRLACVAGAFFVLIAGFDRAAARTSAVMPHVLELFTAQGCTGCAEADQAIKGVIGRPNVLVLAFPVDYWDYLGWKDTLARPAPGGLQVPLQAAGDLFPPVGDRWTQ